MKRLLLIFVLSLTLACIFALGICAQEIKIEANSLEQIKSAISDSVAGDTLIVDMTGDILIPNQKSAIVIDKDITVTINFNGYILFNKGGGGSAGAAYGIVLKSINSKLIMNGNTTVDYKNYVEPQDVALSVSNGEIVNPNKETGVQSPDYASDGPAIVVYSGSVELYNMYINQYNTGEWTVYFHPSLGTNVNVVNNIKAENSIIRSPNTRYSAIGTRQGNSLIVESLVEIENCVIYGTGSTEWISMSANSYIKNTRIAKFAFKIDSYISDSTAHDGQEAILQNVIFENPSISSNTGLIYVKMIDCKFPNGMSLYITGDSKGKTKFTAIQNPTCEMGGGIYHVEIHKGNGKTYTSITQLPTVVEEYEALGHLSQKIVDYPQGYLKNGSKKEGCTRCGLYTEEPLAPLFVSLGYSKSEFADAIVIGFDINYEAIETYKEITDKTVSFGVFAVSQAKLGKNDIFDENGNPCQGVVNAEISHDCDAFEIKVSGFTSKEQKETKLAIGGYVVFENEDSYEYSYLQIDEITDGEKYSFKSYNDYQ